MAIEHRRRPEDIQNPRRRQDDDDDDGDYTYVYRRAEDRSVFLKLSYYIDKYKAVWIVLVSYLLASGFEWKTPASHNAEVKLRVDSLLHRIEEGDRARSILEDKLDVLIKLRCLDIAADPKLASLIDLDCSSYLRWRPEPAPGVPLPIAPRSR